MTCNACGEKPKKTCNDFTKAVIEINNPEVLVLLRKVVIPASMGTEEQVPAAIGKYHNVILKYEANKHVYLYSSDGIPTLLEMDVPQEVWDSIDELQDEIDEMKNSPDVVDIVDTYADLESYDTSELGDKDVVRVLNDETHDGESTYYRWNLSSQTWTFIGGLGPYYTKSETDTLLDTKADKTTTYTKTEVDTALATKANQSTTYTKTEVDTALATKQNNLTAGENITIENNVISADDWIIPLTSDDYDYPDNSPDGVALWRLSTGMYIAPTGVKTYYDSSSSGVSAGPRVTFVNSDLTGPYCAIFTLEPNVLMYVVNKNTGNTVLDTSVLLSSQVVNVLTSTDTNVPLSANQGKVLKDMIDALPAPPTAVQTIGTSTTDVMSQKAVTDMVFYNHATQKVQIGDGADSSSTGNGSSIAIGSSKAKNTNTIAIGSNASALAGDTISLGRDSSSAALATNSVAIGRLSRATGENAVAIGARATATQKGQFDISTGTATWGYNNSNYRLLTGLYDPQNAHDAVTKGYVDPVIGSGAPTTSTSGNVGKIYIDTSTDTAYMCVNSSGGTYTWKQITS